MTLSRLQEYRDERTADGLEASSTYKKSGYSSKAQMNQWYKFLWENREKRLRTVGSFVAASLIGSGLTQLYLTSHATPEENGQLKAPVAINPPSRRSQDEASIDDAEVRSGVIHFNKREFKAAFSVLSPLVKHGNLVAQLYVGAMYLKGHGTAENAALGLTMIREAANKGLADAQNYMAAFYRTGHYVPRTYSLALQWYLRAARQNYKNAQYRIALMYRDGLGVPRDNRVAYMWASIAAKNGPPEATALRNQLRGRIAPVDSASAERDAAIWLSHSIVSNPMSVDTGLGTSGAQANLNAGTEKAQPEGGAQVPEPRPSFDCDRITSVSEKIICENPDLSIADQTLTKLFTRLISGTDSEQMNDEQRYWLKFVRDQCTDGTCLKQAYEKRISELNEDLNDSSRAESIPDSVAQAVVSQFYGALARGDGPAAAEMIVPAKREAGPLSANALGGFYTNLRSEFVLDSVVAGGSNLVTARYRYVMTDGRTCYGSSVVSLVKRNGTSLIAKIKALAGC
jgi:TPR repeat protein